MSVASSRRYPSESRERAVRMVAESRGERWSESARRFILIDLCPSGGQAPAHAHKLAR